MKQSSAEFDWVPETRFGTWFQSSDIWTRYVLCEALDELQRLAADSLPEHPLIMDAGCGAGIAFPLINDEVGQLTMNGTILQDVLNIASGSEFFTERKTIDTP